MSLKALHNKTHKHHSHLSHLYHVHYSSSSHRPLLPHKEKPINWNTTHSFIHSSPLLSLLEKCNSMTLLKLIQSQMLVTGLISDGLAASRLVAFCAMSKAGCIHYCKDLLMFTPQSKVFSWNVTIRGHLERDFHVKEGLFLYKLMLATSACRPDHYTFPLLFKCCARLLWLHVAYGIVGQVLRWGFDSDLFVRNAMIHVFVSCGELGVACKVFDESCVRDLVSWNSLINGYARNGKAVDAVRIFREMEMAGIQPDDVTMLGVVSSCAQLEDLNSGVEFHRLIEEKNIDVTVSLANALVDMYVKCGDLSAAEDMFNKMKKRTVVSWTTMVMGYIKFGILDTAKRLFDEMPEKDVVPWNAMIGGYVQANRSKEALDLFHNMQARNVKPDEVTMVNCLSACSQLGALEVGIWIQHYIAKHKLCVNVSLGTALVDMYVKCGNMDKALQVFSEMPDKNSLTWTCIIGGFATHGNAHDAISYFLWMINCGLQPDAVTFLGLLSACCHGGLVDEGRMFFTQMSSKFNIKPKLKHYSCMVDLLGRAGLLKEAEELIKNMPMKADAVVWGALLFACRVHKNVEIGERAAFKLIEMDPLDSGNYVLLANIYGEANMWERARETRELMKKNRVDKVPGCSSIEIDGNVYEFMIRDKSHQQATHIYDCLSQLTSHLELVGHVYSPSEDDILLSSNVVHLI
ncbi:hypothetical protein ACET3Z_031692 [Daucus carota]